MRIRGALAALALAALLAPAPAAASGAWTSIIRAYTYPALLGERDTVWCATGEAGLLRYLPRDSSFEAITREPSGLASNHLSTLLLDRSGRLWVGTLGAGASRLSADGRTWNLVNQFDGLPSDSVTAMAAINDTVIIGTTKGFALWNGTTVTGALPDGFNPSPFTSDWITGIVAHADTVWVSTLTSVYRSRISTGLASWALEDVSLPPFGFVNMATDGTELFALDRGGNPFGRAFGQRVWDWVKDVAGGGPFGVCFRIYENHGRVMAVTDQGLFVWSAGLWVPLNSTLTSNGSDRLTFSMTVDAQGRFFAANQNGLYERPAAGGAWALRARAAPPGNDVRNVNVDRGRLYVNTYSEGIGRYDGRVWRIWPFDFTCVGCDTTLYAPQFPFALLVDRQGEKWFGCWGAVLDRLDDNVDPPRATHYLYPPPPANADLHTRAWASAADSLGGRWFGMDTDAFGDPQRAPLGLEYYDPAGVYRGSYMPPYSSGKVHGLTVDAGGRLWVGLTGQGIETFDWSSVGPDTVANFIRVPGTERYDVQGLAAYGDTVWALTTSELIAFRRFGTPQPFARYPIPAAPGQLSVNPLAVARDGTVWVGTVNGIRVVYRNGTTQDYTIANSPLVEDEVRAIRIDPATGVVWIGTTGGISRFDPRYRPPPAPPVPRLVFKLYPNPAAVTALGITLRLDGSGTTYTGEVYDLQGRLLRRFGGLSNRGVVWDGRTGEGDLVGPGIYLIRVESGGKSGVARVALLR
jgi:ligand-binding sensor domain-containing protein